MSFLIRMAFWIGLVLVLLPADKTPDSEKMPQVGAADAVSAASAAMSDLGQFCARQPHACAVGGQAATVIGHRAQSGAKKVYDFIRDSKSGKNSDGKQGDAKTGDETGSIGMAESRTAASGDTLDPADLAPQWHGAVAGDGVIVE